MNRLIVLDRDGVINRDSADFIKSPDEWRPIDGSAEAIGRLTQAGYTVAVASNQSGLGRGLFDQKSLAAIHRKMARAIEAAGGRIDRIVYCPHAPDAGCDCRKPLPGLFRQLADHYGQDMAGVYAVGDSLRDLQAAKTAGASPVLVLTGNGEQTRGQLSDAGIEAPVFDNLAAFVDELLGG